MSTKSKTKTSNNDYNQEKDAESTIATKKVDTKYYDELFKRIKDQDLEEFNDQDSLDILYNNIIEQISENENELKKCMNSYHIDYFIYKSSLENFVRLFELLTFDSNKLNDYLSDSRVSRAYEACLALIGEKIALAKKVSTNEDNLDKLKSLLSNLGNYLVENFESIIETHNGVFALRYFLRVIGDEDVVEQTTTNLSNTNKSNKKFQNKQSEFNIKNVQVKQIPKEWKLNKYLKKFSKKLDDLNILGIFFSIQSFFIFSIKLISYIVEIGLVASVSPSISLLLRKLSTSYTDLCNDVIANIHKQFVKKPNSFHSMIQDSIG
jgi:hypothetical protein